MPYSWSLNLVSERGTYDSGIRRYSWGCCFSWSSKHWHRWRMSSCIMHHLLGGGTVCKSLLSGNPIHEFVGSQLTILRRWLFGSSAGPIFFASSLHLCVQRLRPHTRSFELTHVIFRLSSRAYIITCFGIDLLALVFTLIGTALVSAKSSPTQASTKPGFDVMLVAMVVQLCSIAITLIAGFEFTMSFRRDQRRNASSVNSAATCFKRPRLFMAFLISE